MMARVSENAHLPFDRLTVLTRVEGLTALSEAKGRRYPHPSSLRRTPIGMLNYRWHLVGVLKHIVPYTPKPNIFLADASAKKRHWEYHRVPTSAVHELSKLKRNIKALLSSITIPLLLIHSRRDSVADYKCPRYVYGRMGSSRNRLVKAQKSTHILPLDRECPTIAQRVYKFIRECLPRDMAIQVTAPPNNSLPVGTNEERMYFE